MANIFIGIAFGTEKCLTCLAFGAYNYMNRLVFVMEVSFCSDRFAKTKGKDNPQDLNSKDGNCDDDYNI